MYIYILIISQRSSTCIVLFTLSLHQKAQQRIVSLMAQLPKSFFCLDGKGTSPRPSILYNWQHHVIPKSSICYMFLLIFLKKSNVSQAKHKANGMHHIYLHLHYITAKIISYWYMSNDKFNHASQVLKHLVLYNWNMSSRSPQIQERQRVSTVATCRAPTMGVHHVHQQTPRCLLHDGISTVVPIRAYFTKGVKKSHNTLLKVSKNLSTLPEFH